LRCWTNSPSDQPRKSHITGPTNRNRELGKRPGRAGRGDGSRTRTRIVVDDPAAWAGPSARAGCRPGLPRGVDRSHTICSPGLHAEPVRIYRVADPGSGWSSERRDRLGEERSVTGIGDEPDPHVSVVGPGILLMKPHPAAGRVPVPDQPVTHAAPDQGQPGIAGEVAQRGRLMPVDLRDVVPAPGFDRAIGGERHLCSFTRWDLVSRITPRGQGNQCGDRNDETGPSHRAPRSWPGAPR